MPLLRTPLAWTLALLAAAGAGAGTVDVATLDTSGGLLRVHGRTGDGSYGLPVAAGADCDDDGFSDLAFTAMRARPFARTDAGEVYLVFGDGTVSGTLDTATPDARILVLAGAHANENAGSEVWIDDVTGDGVGDLLVARQNHDPDPGRQGAGALSILVGGPELRDYAETLAPLDLASPPPSVTLTTLVGATAGDRLGMWIRTGDVDGDAIADIAVGADQEDPSHRGGAWVVRGGAHLAAGGVVDLAAFGSGALDGNLARLAPSASAPDHSHLGATLQVGDLDGNGRAEVIVAATLNRAGGALQSNLGGSHATGGEVDGTVYIVWDDSFPSGPWDTGYTFAVDDPPGTASRINGANPNQYFGEEILAGVDFDGDEAPDLFVGDIVGDASQANRPASGHGVVFYDAASLAGLSFDLGTPPPGLVTTLVLGAAAGDLAADTVVAGDFDGDGIDDLAIASPHHDPLGRADAGAYHVLFGRLGPWPPVVDLAFPPDPEDVAITLLYGAQGTAGSNAGDTLGYSAASGFVDGDGRLDLVTNEMVGDGLGGAPEDVGNLVVFSGALIAPEPSASALGAVALLAVAALRRRPRR